MDVMVRETRTMIDSMNQSIASINIRVTTLETALNMIRIEKIGTGPTEK